MVRRKVISVLLSVLIIVGTLSGILVAFANDDLLEPNKAMFENVLNQRSWIIDTLVNDDLSTNPVAYVLNVNEGYLDEIVDNYEKSLAYKCLVNFLDFTESPVAYLTDWAADDIAQVLFDVGLLAVDDLYAVLENSEIDHRRYSGILTDIFSENYTSSWDTKLIDEEIHAQTISDCKDAVETISSFKSLMKSNIDLFYGDYKKGSYDSDTFYTEFADYTDDYLDIFESFSEETGLNLGTAYYYPLKAIGIDNYNERKQNAVNKLNGLISSTVLAMGEGYTPVNLLFNDTIRKRANNTLTESMPSGMKSAFKTAGYTLDASETILGYALLLIHMSNQYETTVSSMQRLRSNASNVNMRNAIDDILALYEDDDTWGDYTIACLKDYAKNGLVKFAEKELLKKGSKLLSEAWDYVPTANSLASKALACNVVKNLVRIGNAVSIGVWIGDKLTDIKTSAKKVYAAKFTKQLIADAVATYHEDYAAYQSDPSDENALNCLNDLNFIKRLRLYGEKQAFESTTAMTDSILGVILTSHHNADDTRDYMENRHKSYNDALLGCTFVPNQDGSFKIEAGCELRVGTDIFENGKYITVARYYDKNGKLKKTIPEADWLLGTHLILDGGTLTIENGYDPAGICLAFLQLDAKGGTINIGSNGLYFGNLNVTKPTEINITNSDAEVMVSQEFKNTSTVSLSGGDIITYDFDNSGTIQMTNAEIEVRGKCANSGTVNGSIRITGYQDSPFAVGMLEASQPEITSTGAIAKLTFNTPYKEGVKISGSQTVTEYLNTNRTRLRNSENLYISGSCVFEGNIASATLSFRDYTAPSALDLKGGARIFGDVKFPYPVTVGDGLQMTSSAKTLTLNGPLVIKGDFNYGGGTISGTQTLKLAGDVNISVSNPNIPKLDFVGSTPQTVSTSRDLTVAELENHNTSRGGVSFDSKIYVTDVLRTTSTAGFANGKNVVLTGTAQLDGGTVKGSISAENWTVPDDLTVKGCIYLSGDNVIPDDKAITVSGWQQTSGTLSVGKNTLLDIRGDCLSGGAVANNGAVHIQGDAKLTAAFTGGLLSVKGDLESSAALTPDELEFCGNIGQQFTNSSSTTVKKLTINNHSISGVTINSVINVTETYSPGDSKVNVGKNIIYATEDGTVTLDANGDMTWTGNVTIPAGKTITVDGTLYLSDNTNLKIEDGGSLVIKRNLRSSGAAVTINEGGTLKICDFTEFSGGSITSQGEALFGGDVQLSSCTIAGDGKLVFNGDVNASSCTWNKPNVTLQSAVAQILTSSNDAEVGDLILKNASKTGVTFNCRVKVNGIYTPGQTVVQNSGNLVLVNGSVGLPSSVGGDISLSGPFAIGAGENVTINGSLKLDQGASLTVPKGGVLTVRRHLSLNGGTITVEAGGVLLIRDYLDAVSGTITNDGEITVCGDAAVKATVGGSGLYVFKGDLNAGGVWNNPNVSFISKLPQYLTGSAITVHDLTISNTCGTGIVVQITVNYTGTLQTGDTVITGSDKLVKK